MSIPHPANHPTGIAGVVSTVLLILAPKVGIDLSPELSLTVAGAIVALVSLVSPRVADVHFFEITEEAFDRIHELENELHPKADGNA